MHGERVSCPGAPRSAPPGVLVRGRGWAKTLVGTPRPSLPWGVGRVSIEHEAWGSPKSPRLCVRASRKTEGGEEA